MSSSFSSSFSFSLYFSLSLFGAISHIQLTLVHPTPIPEQALSKHETQHKTQTKPKTLTQKIKQTTGVLESGIFLRKPDIIYKANTNGKFEII